MSGSEQNVTSIMLRLGSLSKENISKYIIPRSSRAGLIRSLTTSMLCENSSGQLTTSQNKPVLLFGGTILGVLIQTFTLALIINSLGQHTDIGITDGAGVGFALGVGISMFSSLSHRLFGGESLKVWVVETANDAINLTIAGAIIAFFNC